MSSVAELIRRSAPRPHQHAILRFASARQEIRQQRIHLVWRIQLHPVAGTLEALVPPWAGHVLGGVGHLSLSEGGVPRAPDAHGGGLHRRELNRRADPRLRRHVGPVPVEARGQRTSRLQLGDHLVGVGVPGPGPEVVPVVLGQPPLGDAGELEQQHVPRLLTLPRRAAEGSRVPDGERDQMVHLAGHEGRERPGQRGTPVVAHHVGPLDPQVGQDRHDVPGDVHERVGLDGLGFVGAPVSAQVGDDDLEPRTGEGRHLVPPQPAGIGKTVQQNDRRSLPRGLVLDTHSVDVHPGHLDLPFTGSWSSMSLSRLPGSAIITGVRSHGDLVAAGGPQFEAALVSFVADNRLPGGVAGVVYGDELAWSAGAGFADLAARRAADPAMLYAIASITKTFTGTAIMQLRDAGQVDLDDPAVAWLPELRQAVSPFGPIEGVTIRRMLSHESGLPAEPPGTDWTIPAYQGDPEQTLRRAGEIAVTLAPNAEHKYSDLAYQLLGAIVTRASGIPYPNYMQEAILQPLGMAATAFAPLSAGMAARCATGYDWRALSDELDPAPAMPPVW